MPRHRPPRAFKPWRAPKPYPHPHFPLGAELSCASAPFLRCRLAIARRAPSRLKGPAAPPPPYFLFPFVQEAHPGRRRNAGFLSRRRRRDLVTGEELHPALFFLPPMVLSSTSPRSLPLPCSNSPVTSSTSETPSAAGNTAAHR
jgi:hypothetical protein